MMGVLLCDLKPGDRVLVNGASGGVGSFGVKLAKALGAHVTAMCSAEKADVVRSWGADEVVDYKTASAQELQGNSYDAVFDPACFESPSRFERVHKDNGRYVLVGGSFYNMLRLKAFGRRYGRGAQQFKTLTQEVGVAANIEREGGDSSKSRGSFMGMKRVRRQPTDSSPTTRLPRNAPVAPRAPMCSSCHANLHPAERRPVPSPAPASRFPLPCILAWARSSGARRGESQAAAPFSTRMSRSRSDCSGPAPCASGRRRAGEAVLNFPTPA